MSENLAASLLSISVRIFKIELLVRFNKVHLRQLCFIVLNVVSKWYLIRLWLSPWYYGARPISAHGRPRTAPTFDNWDSRLTGKSAMKIVEVVLIVKLLTISNNLRFGNPPLIFSLLILNQSVIVPSVIYKYLTCRKPIGTFLPCIFPAGFLIGTPSKHPRRWVFVIERLAISFPRTATAVPLLSCLRQ